VGSTLLATTLFVGHYPLEKSACIGRATIPGTPVPYGMEYGPTGMLGIGETALYRSRERVR
jgi:hypothetical protein